MVVNVGLVDPLLLLLVVDSAHEVDSIAESLNAWVVLHFSHQKFFIDKTSGFKLAATILELFSHAIEDKHVFK